MAVVKGILLDTDYENNGDYSAIRVYVKTSNGIQAFTDKSFHPYFFATARNISSTKQILEETVFEENTRINKIDIVKKNNDEVLRLEFKKVEHLTIVRDEIKKIGNVIERFEYDIPFTNRYLIDKQLEPMNGVQLETENNEIKSIRPIEAKETRYNIACFDIETLSPGRFSDPKKDPAIMISVAVPEKETIVLTFKPVKQGFVKTVQSEKAAIEEFLRIVRESKPDIIATYNGDMFDFPFLRERAATLKTKLAINPDGTEPKARKKGIDSAVKLKGIQHLDAYQMLRLLNRMTVTQLVKFDLESAAETLFGKPKEKIKPEEINKIWREENQAGLARLANYNKEDTEVTLAITQRYLPLLVELSKLVKRNIFDVCRGSASMLVEHLIMNKCFETGMLARNRPKEEEVKHRMMQSFAGGYVKEPVPGLHENIAVLDFSSLHPTIMISHNISPENLDCPHPECKSNMSPNNHWFCKKKEGFLSSILKELLETRMEIKKKLKKIDKKNKDYLLLDARQLALKILLNSFYGYLGYARSRWYSIESAAAVTAWSRNYVKDVGRKAEQEAGFKLLYSDTDSAFLSIPKNKAERDVEKFVEKINTELPGVMHLELQGFYKRGIFVTKETGEGAKKKYALIDSNNNLKIVGFEYVRRDWAPIAKETQKEVIRAILEEGNPEKAVRIVKEKIQQLKEGKVQKTDLVILTQVKRELGKYETIGPHIAAAQKAVKRGKELSTGSVIGYIITRSGKSISEKAELEEYVKEGNYDADYYIEHQVIPAVYKVIRELGYSKEDLIQGGKQKTLF